MKQKKTSNYFLLAFTIAAFTFVFQPLTSSGQSENNFFYKKKERTLGVIFNTNTEYEELLTDETRKLEELRLGNLNLQLKNCFWTFVDYKQEQLNIAFDLGPIYGNGSWIDSSKTYYEQADHSLTGLRAKGEIDYSNLFYYSSKSFTLMQVKARGYFDLFRQHSIGTTRDSNRIITDLDEKFNATKFRYGFAVRAGWGTGRLQPMNHAMVTDYLLEKNYKGRTFSDKEKQLITRKIEKIKNHRSLATGHDIVKEADDIAGFLNQSMFLLRPENLASEWQYAEFLPRFHGSKVEIGPFFNHFNREPDFVYGGYLRYISEKYHNFKRNSSINAEIKYNRYKTNDWLSAEVALGWSYYFMLKSQFYFGFKYVPIMPLKNFKGLSDINHGVVPNISYFTQISNKTRFSFDFAWQISEDKAIMQRGPEIMFTFFRSWY
ncbi:MAG: hypothetical protein CSA36_01940 [Draconibacterium sp.]|nr:MAG: hypothetical protein CSA36_01940 [Draconibacterium sp.]